VEPSCHVVGNIDRGLESHAYHPRDAFRGITSEFCGFVVCVGTSRRIEDRGDDERVVCYAETDGAYGAEDGGDGAGYWVCGSLVLEVC
jgi:hypothetical protein